MSIAQIARQYGVASTCVYHLFKSYNYRPRTLKEAMALLKKPSTKHGRTRLRALTILGGRCAHCGCDDPRLLEIHHKYGGGKRDRQGSGGSNFVYNIVMGRRSTEDLEVCCRPCHAIEEVKRMYGVSNFEITWRGY